MQNQFYYQPQGNPTPLQQAYQQQLYYKRKRKNEAHELIITGVVIGATIVASLVIQVVLGVAVMYGEWKTLFNESSLFQNAFNIIAVDIFSLIIPYFIMSRILAKRYTDDLIPRKKVGRMPAFAWVCVGMGCCVGANYITALVIEIFKQFGYELTQSEYVKPSNALECVMIVFSTMLAPALCEEFAMRCCSLGALKKYGKGFAVVAVSIVFGLIHGNVIQFVFAFLLGLVFGYITIATDSILPAMLIHGLNNGISVLNDIVVFAAGNKAAEYVGPVCYIAWLCLAGWGLVYLLFKKKLIMKKQPKLKEPYALSFGAKLLCLMPGFAVPIGILIAITSQYIVPIK